ncbi:MAG: MFS transporter [Betaproteobacteria bacterium]
MTSTASAPAAPGLSPAKVMGVMLAASIASTIGGLPFNALPVMLGSLAEAFKLEPAAVGFMGSVCFAGYLLGTLGAPLWIERLNWRLLTVLSAAGTAGAFALSAVTADLKGQYVAWALIGFFASTMTCLGMRILSDLPDKVRAFGVRQGVELSITAAVLFALPPLVIAHWQYLGAAGALAVVVALLGVSAWWVPARSVLAAAAPAAGAAATRPRVPRAAWVGLGVFFVYLVGNIGLWAFLERIGAGLKLEPSQTGIVFAVLKLLGGVAAFSVGALGERWPERRAHLAALALLLCGLGLLGAASCFAGFALGAWIWEFAFTCGCVLQAAHIARRDPSGRAILLVPAAFALASMVGPGLAGQLFTPGAGQVLLLAALASVAPTAAVWVRR